MSSLYDYGNGDGDLAPEPMRPLSPLEEDAARKWLENVLLEGDEEAAVARLVDAAIDEPYCDEGQRGLAMLHEHGAFSYMPHDCAAGWPDAADWCPDCRAARIEAARAAWGDYE